MITATNLDKITKQLEEYEKEVERKLKFMVEQFAVDVVQAGVNNTPLGDSEKYAAFYKVRLTNETGLLDIEGLARGSWQIDLDGNLTFTNSRDSYGKNSGSNAVKKAEGQAKGYKLGQTFVIGNAAPYIGELENNSSMQTQGQGIVAPTLAEIQAAHESDLKRYYDAG